MAEEPFVNPVLLMGDENSVVEINPVLLMGVDATAELDEEEDAPVASLDSMVAARPSPAAVEPPPAAAQAPAAGAQSQREIV